MFVCSRCDSQFSKWLGRCPECGTWGSFAEQNSEIVKQKKAKEKIVLGSAKPVATLKSAQSLAPRLPIKIKSVSQVFGFGLPIGSVTLLAGAPGVGKSTLAMQLAVDWGRDCLYVSAEESEVQLANRLTRLAPKAQVGFIQSDDLEEILATAVSSQIKVLIIDSIQTISSSNASGSAGSVNQVKACASQLQIFSKEQQVAVIIVGHINKSGDTAGPKALEHLVDIVINFSGEHYRQARLLRASKNRYGAVGSSAFLEMTPAGLKEVLDPSKILLRGWQSRPGSVICPVSQGDKILLIEVQALLAKAVNKYPKRSANGFDQKRLEMLVTVLFRHADVPLNYLDVFVNVVGGIYVEEPAVDLAICSAIVSAFRKQSFARDSVIFGEVGLAGEVRVVAKTKERLQEANRLKLKTVMAPSVEKIPIGLNWLAIDRVNQISNYL
jgi:DNA repair protein RadA/Sms